MSDDTERRNWKLRQMLDDIKKESFTEDYDADDAEAMGLLVARFGDMPDDKWDGAFILRVTEYALEDANFHDECAEVAEIRKRVEGE